jgi:hypothetical protein
MRPDRVRLKYHPDPASFRRDKDAFCRAIHRSIINADFTSDRLFQAGNAAQRCRLAATARAKQGK